MGIVLDMQNITPLEFNNSLINTTDIIVATIDNANSATNNNWFIISIIVFFLFIFYIAYDQRGVFRFDVPRSFLFASAFSCLLSIIFAISPIINTIVPIIWFSALTFISFIVVLSKKEKGQ